jgi:hypothetical protein
MAEVDDLRLSDIAEVLAIPEGTVASRLARARDDFAAAVQRRRVAQERRPAVAHLAPIALLDARVLLEAGRTPPQLSDELFAGPWDRIQRAITGSTWAGLAVLAPASLAAIVLGALAAGAAAGALATLAALHRTEPPAIVATEERASSGSAAAAPATPPASESAGAAGSSRAPASEPVAATAASVRPAMDPALAERAERAILESARAAMLRGDTKAALRELGRHAAQFPSGIYKEEREALRARAQATRTAGKP